MRDFVKDGTVKAFQLWSPYNEGWLAALLRRRRAQAARSRTKSGRPSRFPNLGTITIGDKNVMNTQAELTTFDASNIDDFNF